MKSENLEPLLLDRAFGELSPAVAELLEEHLAREPSAAQQAAVFTATLQSARQAVAVPAAASLRPLALARLRRAERQLRWRSHLGELVKLAACVAFGLVLGRAARTEQPEPGTAPTQAASVTAAPAGVQEPVSRFWSLASLATERRMQSTPLERRERIYRLHWDSPLKMPRLEEKP